MPMVMANSPNPPPTTDKVGAPSVGALVGALLVVELPAEVAHWLLACSSSASVHLPEQCATSRRGI